MNQTEIAKEKCDRTMACVLAEKNNVPFYLVDTLIYGRIHKETLFDMGYFG